MYFFLFGIEHSSIWKRGVNEVIKYIEDFDKTKKVVAY